MTPSFLAPVIAAALSLVLSICLLISVHTTEGLRTELQKKQEEMQAAQEKVQATQQTLQAQQEQIQSGTVLANQVGPQVLQDLARRAVEHHDDKIRKLLQKHNLSIQEKDAAKPGDKSPEAPEPEKPASDKTEPEKPEPSSAAPSSAEPATPAPRPGPRLSVPRPRH